MVISLEVDDFNELVLGNMTINQEPFRIAGSPILMLLYIGKNGKLKPETLKKTMGKLMVSG